MNNDEKKMTADEQQNTEVLEHISDLIEQGLKKIAKALEDDYEKHLSPHKKAE